jgi:hypothetical protein
VFEKDWLPKLILDPSFLVSSSRRKGDILEIDIDWTRGPANAKRRSKGTIDLDSNRDYTIAGYRIVTDTNQATIQSDAYYQYAQVGNHHRPMRIEWTERSTNKKTSITSSYIREYDFRYERDPVTEADCSLSAYGFPEPQGVTLNRPTPRYIWILVAAGVCGALALLLRWLPRKGKGVNTAPSPVQP